MLSVSVSKTLTNCALCRNDRGKVMRSFGIVCQDCADTMRTGVICIGVAKLAEVPSERLDACYRNGKWCVLSLPRAMETLRAEELELALQDRQLCVPPERWMQLGLPNARRSR